MTARELQLQKDLVAFAQSIAKWKPGVREESDATHVMDKAIFEARKLVQRSEVKS